MSHYVSRNLTELPAYMFADVKVPATMINGLIPGNVVVAESLDSTIYGNKQTYIPTVPATVATEEIAIVLNGTFEQMSDGRRPDGNPDYTTYIFQPGEIATTVRIMKNQKFELSIDACDATVAAAATAGTLVAGDNLIPKANQTALTYSAEGTAINTKNYLTVEALNFFRLGGQNGAQFAPTMIVRAH